MFSPPMLFSLSLYPEAEAKSCLNNVGFRQAFENLLDSLETYPTCAGSDVGAHAAHGRLVFDDASHQDLMAQVLSRVRIQVQQQT
eukprot:3931877-Rhodomonas_salina.3